MKISATLENKSEGHEVVLRTGEVEQILNIPAGANRTGSSVNGGELLCLALATCYCNDLYREAKKRNIRIHRVHVESFADFAAPGEAGTNFRYVVSLDGDAPREALEELARHTDTVAEIQKTLRNGSEIHFITGPLKNTLESPH